MYIFILYKFFDIILFVFTKISKNKISKNKIMASSSSSSSSSFFNNEKELIETTITQEEFFAFHNIDRQLFARLVFSMRREPMEAMHAAAFWLWLERLNMAQYVATLLTYSDEVFKVVFEETFLCLRVVELDTFVVHGKDVILIQSIVGKFKDGVKVNLRFFHDNRISILLGIGHFIENICLRAFQDLIQTALENRANPVNYNIQYLPEPSVVGGVHGGGGGGFSPAPRPALPHELGIIHPSLRVGEMSVPLKSDQSNVSGNSVISNTNYGLENQPQVLQGDLLVDQLLSQLRLNENSWAQKFEDKSNLLPSERTIFLTFSKGYPILENELREFFNRYIFFLPIFFFHE